MEVAGEEAGLISGLDCFEGLDDVFADGEADEGTCDFALGWEEEDECSGWDLVGVAEDFLESCLFWVFDDLEVVGPSIEELTLCAWCVSTAEGSFCLDRLAAGAEEDKESFL